MARLCLPKEYRETLRRAIKSRDIDLFEIQKLTSEQRQKLFEKYVDDSASLVNAKFEQAMLSSQNSAMERWVLSVTQPKSPIRRSMLKRIERNQKLLTPDEEKGFLTDLVEDKLGLRVTEAEASDLLKLKNEADELLTKIAPDSPRGSEERLAYGFALDRYKTKVGDMMREADKISWKERLTTTKFIGRTLYDLASITKSMVASIDNSFIGRQGIKVLFTNPKIWAKTLKESFETFGKELVAEAPEGFFKSRNDAVMSAIRADVYSSPNAINGKYNASKNGYGLGVDFEESFPTSLPERLPLFGRFFKASESAFSGSALRMRQRLADQMIERGEKMGLDMLDEKNASAFGNLVTAMTGRAELPQRIAPIGDTLNVALFSPRFLMSNWETLTMHSTDRFAIAETRKIARQNLTKIVSSITGLLLVNEMLNPGSVVGDPRSSNFGKINLGGYYYDITGGMSGITRLASRLALRSRTSVTTGKTENIFESGFGKQTALDEIENFFEGKLSPIGGAARDILQGRNYDGEKPNFFNTTIGMITPISAEMFVEELRKGNDFWLVAMLAEGLGFSPTDTIPRRYGVKWDKLKEQDNDEYNDGLRQVQREFSRRVDELEKSPEWKKMTREEKNKALDKIRNEETDRVMRQYGIR